MGFSSFAYVKQRGAEERINLQRRGSLAVFSSPALFAVCISCVVCLGLRAGGIYLAVSSAAYAHLVYFLGSFVLSFRHLPHLSSPHLTLFLCHPFSLAPPSSRSLPSHPTNAHSFAAFVAYQYCLHVVPTTYIAPRSAPLHTNQYRCVESFLFASLCVFSPACREGCARRVCVTGVLSASGQRPDIVSPRQC
jgi:hypothetical protein